VKSTVLATAGARLTLEKKASDVLVMDLRGLSSVTDHFVVCSADSDVQIRAIADAVVDGLEKKGVEPWHKETGSPNWVIIDYVDVVLHIFHKTTRSYYSLEKLWGDARMKAMHDAPPAPRARRSSRVKGTRVKRTPAAKPAKRKAKIARRS
jgi:ribosome-associated protein